MALARKILSNTAWQVFGKAATAILGIISIKFITNYLSRSTYGEYTTIYDYTALFAIVADFGLFTIAVREMAHAGSKEMTEKIVGNVLSIRTVLAIFSLGVGVIAALLIPAYKSSHIPYGILIVSLATIVTLVAGTMSSVLQFHLRMHWASIGMIVGKLLTVIYIVATVLYIFPGNPDAGFPHLLYGWIGGSLVTLLITYIASGKNIPIHFQFDFAFWKRVILIALPYGCALVLGTIYFRMGTLVLSIYGMKDQVGYYGVPLRFLEILQIVPHYFMNSVLPVLTISLKQGSERAAKIVKYAIGALASLAMPILVGGYFLAWPITAAVSSPDFLSYRVNGGMVLGSDIALKILLVAMTFTYLHVGLSYALVAMGRQIELLWINAIAVIINITLNLLLAPRFGFIGSSISEVVTELSMLILLLIRTRKYIRNVWSFSFLAKTVFSAAVMGAVLNFTADYFNQMLQTKSLFILVPLGGIVFVSCMLFTKAITKEMIALFRKTEPAQTEITTL